MNTTFIPQRPAKPLHENAAQSERKLVETCVLRLCELAAKHAADRAFLLGRAAAYQARGDTDVSDVIGQADAAGERLAAVERQIKELQR